MKIIADDQGCTGFVIVSDAQEATTIDLSDDVVASISATGEFVGLDLMDTRPFGVPFDEAAAKRALTWARARLDVGSAS